MDIGLFRYLKTKSLAIMNRCLSFWRQVCQRYPDVPEVLEVVAVVVLAIGVYALIQSEVTFP